MDYIGVKRVDDERRDRRRAAADRALHVEGLRRVGAPDPARPPKARVDHAVGGPDRRARTTTRRSSRSSTASPRTSCSRPPPPSCAPRSWRSSGMQEEGGVRLFLRRDPVRRTVAAVVALPRDHVSTELRIRLEHLFELRFGGRAVDYTPLVRHRPGPVPLHDPRPGGRHPRPAAGRAPARGGRRRPQLGRLALGRARRQARRAGAGTSSPAATRRGSPTTTSRPRAIYQATFDVEQFERLGADRPYVVALQNEQGTAEPLTRLKLYKTGGKAPLTDLLPLLEQLGLTVVEEVPTRLVGDRRGRPLPARLRRARPGRQAARPRADGGHRRRHGRCRLGGPGRVGLAEPAGRRRRSSTGAGSRSCAPTGSTASCSGRTFTSRYQNDCLVRNSAISRKLVRLFELRFDPAAAPRRGRRARARRRDRGRPRRRAEPRRRPHPARVPGHDPSRRCARARTSPDREHLSFKLRCADVPGMPKPVPLWEIFVFSTEMAGVHLRGGHGGARRHPLVGPARGLPHRDPGPDEGADGEERGDRPGRRQGRVRPQAPAARPRRADAGGAAPVHHPDARPARHHRQHRRRARSSTPRACACSTATTPTWWSRPTRAPRTCPTPPTRSSQEYGFWLGDAFASGGSAGYDHKALGITAKGAWESVKRHFRELGRDVATEPVTAVGDRRHVGRRVRKRDAALGAPRARGGVRPPARLPRPDTRRGGGVRRAAPALRRPGDVVGRLRPHR